MRQVLDADDWLQADLKLARVTDDPIGILLKNGTISFTDLPSGGYNKLITRQGLRIEMSYVEALFCSDKDNYLSDSMVLRIDASCTLIPVWPKNPCSSARPSWRPSQKDQKALF